MFNKNLLEDRARMFNIARSYFSEKKILEVDPPALTKNTSIDLHIEVMETYVTEKDIGYLHTSPEYLMKRLLAKKLGNIFFLGHVFRKGEIGDLHNPEFTLVEWYRRNISYDIFILETLDFIKLFLPGLEHKKTSYKELLSSHTGIDYLKADLSSLKKFVTKHIDISRRSLDDFDKDSLLNLIMSHLVEPHLGSDMLQVVDSYPASQAALAKVHIVNNEKVAKRFEIYYQGIELANGFHELQNPKEQKRRFTLANIAREKMGKKRLALDKMFLKALKEGIGDCCGVAVGFDRMLMLRHKKKRIKEVIPFSWDET